MAKAANVWVLGPKSPLAAGFLNPPEPEPLQPRDPGRVGGYTLVGRLGVGGMGVAYLARDAAGREVALKVVHAGLSEHEEFRIHFIREVAAARRVPGRHTARVLDADVRADPPWLATEYFRCWTLAQQVPRFGPLTVENAGTLIAGLADALAAMHAIGLVHRDLKPSNILLAPDGPRIIDFGLARAAGLASLTSTGRLPGTPGYMAPEQIEGRETGPPADVFALGASLVYAMTGTSPFWDGAPTTLMYRTVHGEPDLLGMPEVLRELTRRCLAKEAGERPTAADLVAEFGASPDERAATEVFDGKPAIEDIEVTDASRGDLAETERIVLSDRGARSSQNGDFLPPARRRRPGLAIAASVGGLAAAAVVALALATNSGSTATPPAPTVRPRPPTTPPSTPSTTPPTTSATRSASAIPAQPPPLPQTLVGYSGRLLGQNLAWFQSLNIPTASVPWSGGGLWSAIAGPGCPAGAGHGWEASTGWSPDAVPGGAPGTCANADLTASAVPPGQAATAHVTWTFTPGTAVCICAVFAYNAASPANLAFGDYAFGGRAGQFPMSGASHAGEWVELGLAPPAADGTVTVGVGNDQLGDAQHAVGATVTAAQVVAVCGGPST